MSKKHLDDFNDSTQSIADDKSLDKNLDDGASGDESKDEYNLGSVQSKFRKVKLNLSWTVERTFGVYAHLWRPSC